MLAILFSLAPATLAQKVQEHEKDDPRARAEYLVQKRGGKQGTPPGAREHALKEVNGMLEREGKAYWQSVSAASSGSTTESTAAVRESSAIAPSASQWTPIGPQPTNPNPANSGGGAHFSGRVTALAVDPNTPATVYLGAAQGGVWKSVDSGTSWTALTDSQLSLATGSIAIDPTNSQVIYVGTGEENYGSDSYYGVGILKSTNGGASWTRLGQQQFAPTTLFCTSDFLGCGGARIGAIAIQPGVGNNGHLLAAVNTAFSNSAGLFWSPDAGATWTAVSGAASAPADSVVFVNSTTALVGIHKQGVFTCSGFATTPTCVGVSGNGSVITVTGTDRVSLGTDGAGTAYAALAVASTSALSGLYKSTDAGVNWTKLTNTPDFCTDQCFYDMLVAVNPANPNNVFVGGSGFPNNNFLYRTTDGGANWTLATTNIHADQHAASFTSTGGKMYIGNDGGVYSTTDTTTGTSINWTELNSSLNITQFYGYFGLHPTDSQVTYGGTQDNGTQKYSGNLAWDEATCGDGAGAVVDVNTPSTVFANCQLVDVRRSTSGNPGTFGSQNTAGSGITDSSRVGFIPPMVGDTGNPMKVYFGSYRLWQATSNGSSPTWAAITGDLTGGGSETITNIAITPDNSTAFVVTTDGRFSKVINLGSSASATTAAPPTPANTQISGVAAVSSNVAYIAVPGFTAGSHVFKTPDGGTTWSNITNNLPNTPANDIVVDPDIAGTLYLATDVGVFVSINDGASWATLRTGLPNVAVLGLKLHRPSRTLRAATHGRGMWDLAVPSCVTGPCATLSPGGLTFGQQKVGITSSPAIVTLTNTGTTTLTVSNVSIPAGDFAQTNNCTSIAPSGSCTINVTFSPSAAGVRSNTLTVTSNANPTTTTASLSGTGIIIPVNDVFDFAKVINVVPYTNTIDTLGAVSAQTDPVPPSPSCVTLSTVSGDALDYDPNPRVNHHAVWYRYTPSTSGNISIDTIGSAYDTILSVWTGDLRVGFTAVNPTTLPNGCNDDINPGVLRTSQIQNLPVSAGVNYDILVTGYYPSESGTMTINVSGTAPALLSKASVNMSSIIGRSSSETLTYFNNTGSTITVSGVGISGAAFARSETCTGSPIANGGSCSITVTFSPGAVGPFTGSITVNDSGGTRNVTLNGTGVNFTLSAARNSRNGATGTGVSTAPGSRPTRPVRSAADIIVVAGQSKSMDLELASTGTSNEVVTLECVGAPAGTQCNVEPAQVTLAAASIPIQVTFNTSKPGSTSGRAKRLSSTLGIAAGDYQLQVNARVGNIVRSTLITATVESNPAPTRIKRELRENP
ncbi:MAG: glycosyl hydrolase [Acidobacteriaceae bacterium]|nr:glycosyl hydrolase [Acidobacteriaceae bacterium]